jgi:uncharacterized membrane protein
MADAKPNILLAVEWLWSLRGKNVWWTPAVFTDINKDTAPPKFTHVEAETIFELLVEKGLLIRRTQNGQPGFLMQEAKPREWEAFIAELKGLTSDNSLPPKDGGESERDSRTDDDPSQGNHENEKKIGIAEILGGVVFVGIGCGCTEVEAHYPALLFYWLSAACGIDGLIRLCGWRRAINWTLQVLTLAVFMGLCLWQFKHTPKPEPDKPPFKIVSRFLSVVTNNQRTMLFLNHNGQDVLLPIPVEFYADFINSRNSPLTIRSYQFEGRTTKSNWVQMTTINPDDGYVLWFTGTNVDAAHPILKKSFGNNVWPNRIAGKEIGGGETVPSVVLLDLPKDGFDGPLRLRIKDSADNEYVEDVINGTTNAPATSAIGDAFASSFICQIPANVISHAVTNRYSDEMK